ncbi:MAG: ABC transporter ATP-binding protein [bacterium]|nr:ABC transporter ATP-binding protein [bacterium]
MTLDLQFRLERGALELAVDLAIASGETLAVVGPNGAGKSTLLTAVAGLLRIGEGRIEHAGRLLDGGPGAGFVPPEERAVGCVFQDALLFPHLTVLENVAFGLRARGVERPAARQRAAERLERVGLAEQAGWRPAELSGGQAQRVALARALATDPAMLLLDEPLANVDATARLELRRELQSHLTEFSGVRIVVAHDAIDALALADRVAVLEGGKITQVATVAEICSQPRSRYVADLIGVNLLRGRMAGDRLVLPGGESLVVGAGYSGEVLATVHPRAIALYQQRPEGSPRNVWRATIGSLESAGDRVRVQLAGQVPLVAEVTPAAVADLELGVGGEIWLALKATEITIYPD